VKDRGLAFDIPESDIDLFINAASAEMQRPVVSIAFQVDDEKNRCTNTEQLEMAGSALPGRLSNFELSIRDEDDPGSRRILLSLAGATAHLSVEGSSRTWARGAFITLSKNVQRHQNGLAKLGPTPIFVGMLIAFCVVYFADRRDTALGLKSVDVIDLLAAIGGLCLLVGGFAVAALASKSYVELRSPPKWLRAPEWLAIEALAAVALLLVAIFELLVHNK